MLARLCPALAWGFFIGVAMAEEKVELRGNVDRDIIDMLDAVSGHLRIPRIVLAEKILRRWAEDKFHESTVVLRVVGSNGSSWADRGTDME